MATADDDNLMSIQMNDTAAKLDGRTDRRSFDDSLITIVPCNYLAGDGLFGRGLALVLLLCSLPLIGILVLLTRLGSKGPGLYRQVRVGKQGKIFVMYKIRSMYVDAEAETGPVWTQDDHDPRITPFGVVVRKSHLDELPQLYNIVRGDMSLFGPRPERPELVHVLAENIPGYLNRLAVRPGIIGLAQSNLPPDSSLESVRRKLELDLEYVEKANLWMDCRMFVWAVLRLLGVPAEFATSRLGLSRDVEPVWSASAQPVSISQLIASSRESRERRQSGAPPAILPATTEIEPC